MKRALKLPFDSGLALLSTISPQVHYLDPKLITKKIRDQLPEVKI